MYNSIHDIHPGSTSSVSGLEHNTHKPKNIPITIHTGYRINKSQHAQLVKLHTNKTLHHAIFMCLTFIFHFISRMNLYQLFRNNRNFRFLWLLYLEPRWAIQMILAMPELLDTVVKDTAWLATAYARRQDSACVHIS